MPENKPLFVVRRISTGTFSSELRFSRCYDTSHPPKKPIPDFEEIALREGLVFELNCKFPHFTVVPKDYNAKH